MTTSPLRGQAMRRITSPDLRAKASAAQNANRLVRLRVQKTREELAKELAPKLIGVRTSWAGGQGPAIRSLQP